LIGKRHFRLGLVSVALATVFALFGASLALEGKGEQALTATLYQNAARFNTSLNEASALRVELFDLQGARLFDSGPVFGRSVDWPLTNQSGQRVARGVYLYVATVWDDSGEELSRKLGKLAVAPGAVGLSGQPAPELPLVSNDREGQELEPPMPVVRPLLTSDCNTSGCVADHDGVIRSITGGGKSGLVAMRGGGLAMAIQSGLNGARLMFDDNGPLELMARSQSDVLNAAGAVSATKMRVTPDGKVGIGNDVTPSAQLEVHGTSGDLLRLENPNAGGAVFRVENDGNVYADRSYNCGLSSQGACFVTGQGADLAERIDTTETLEAGDVVEIDPERPSHFRKSHEAGTTRVAGVISTAPGVTLGNNFDPANEVWTDERPLLALAGRVPVKVTDENGPIRVGDWLVAAGTPGHAMRCSEGCTGAVIGKALEPLNTGRGQVLALVTLR